MKAFFTNLTLFLATAALASAQSGPLTISAGRAVQLDLKGVSTEESARFRGIYPVGDDGFITLPNLTEPVRAAGLTSSQLSKAIAAAYRAAQIYKDPTILVISDDTQNPEQFTVTIGGQAKRPGPVRFTQGMTLYQALQAGGGATEFGSMRRVSLIRKGKATVYDLTKNQNKNLLVEPNDTLEVPQKTLTGG